MGNTRRLCRRRLCGGAGKSGVDTGPTGCLRAPDRHCRPCDFRIVESPCADEDEMRPRLRLTKEVRAAHRAEAPMHHVAAVGDAPVVAGTALDGDGGSRETDIHGAVARGEVLAHPAPADASHDGRCGAPIACRTAKTASENLHRLHLISYVGIVTEPFLRHRNMSGVGEPGGCSLRGSALFLRAPF